MLTRIDHIGIACFDLDKTVEFYRATYGFEVFHSEVNEEQGVREAMLKINETSDGGASYLQLLEPTREDSAVGKWLAKNGEGVHHIAFGTADVDGDAADIRDKGVRVLYEEPRHRLHGVPDHLPAPQGLPRSTDRTGHFGRLLSHLSTDPRTYGPVGLGTAAAVSGRPGSRREVRDSRAGVRVSGASVGAAARAPPLI